MTRIIMLYDDTCPMCVAQMRWLSALDWFHMLETMPASSKAAQACVPEVSHDVLMTGIHCKKPDGQVLQGVRALRAAGLRVPLLVPVTLLLWIPGMRWLADIVYGKISRNRYVLSKFFRCKDTCAVKSDSEHDKK